MKNKKIKIISFLFILSFFITNPTYAVFSSNTCWTVSNTPGGISSMSGQYVSSGTLNGYPLMTNGSAYLFYDTTDYEGSGNAYILSSAYPLLSHPQYFLTTTGNPNVGTWQNDADGYGSPVPTVISSTCPNGGGSQSTTTPINYGVGYMSATNSNQVATVLGASVSTSTASVWSLIILIISIPLAFYIIQNIRDLFPKEKGRLKEHNDYGGKVLYDDHGNVKSIIFDKKK